MDSNIKTVSNLDARLEMVPLTPRKILNGAAGTVPRLLSPEDRNMLVTGTKARPYRPNITLTQSLLGDQDRRSEVVAPDTAPWCMICSLRIHAKTGDEYIGTGWIAGPRLIITAGHCVYHEDILGGWASDVEVFPGHSDGAAAKAYSGMKFETSIEWRYRGDENFDIGAIFLAEDIGSEYGAFSVGTYPDEFLQDRLINISGYPSSRYGETQLHHANRIKSVTQRKLYYDLDTEGGQSGSPAWIYEDDQLEKPIVVGVHAHGAGNASIGNSGVRITPQILRLINDWRSK